MGPASAGDLCCRFTIDELRQVRRAALAWARRAGLGERAEDFVLALNEITTNAIRHGSPAAVLRLRPGGPGGVLAEVSDSGRWPAQQAPPEGAADGIGGLALARRLCEQVSIGTGPEGTTVTLQMTAPPAARGPGPGCGTSGHRPG